MLRRDDQRRPLQLLDDVGDRERLAAAGDAEQHLRGVAAHEACDQLLDGARLIAHRAQGGVQSKRRRHGGSLRAGAGWCRRDLARPPHSGPGPPRHLLPCGATMSSSASRASLASWSGPSGRFGGYYAILDLAPGFELAAARVRARALLAAAPCMLQVRAKGSRPAHVLEAARALLPETRAAGVPLCVNDRVDVALLAGADAVHVGQDDLPLAEVRKVAGARLVVGVSTHDAEQVAAAIAGGADYIGYGPVFATGSKQNPDPVVGPSGLRAAVVLAREVPVVAIGGITLDTIAAVAATGAAAAAVIAAVNGAPDPTAAARAVAAAFRVAD